MWAICADCISEYAWYIFKYHSYTEYIDRLSQKLILRNVLFVKLFQGLSANSYLDESTTECLLQYTTNTPYTECDIDYPTLLAAVNKYNIQLYNDERPINSGMISIYTAALCATLAAKLLLKYARKTSGSELIMGAL